MTQRHYYLIGKSAFVVKGKRSKQSFSSGYTLNTIVRRLQLRCPAPDRRYVIAITLRSSLGCVRWGLLRWGECTYVPPDITECPCLAAIVHAGPSVITPWVLFAYLLSWLPPVIQWCRRCRTFSVNAKSS